MSRTAWLVPVLVVAWPLAAAAQPAGQRLTETQTLGRQLFNQSCMVCHTKPQITSGMYGPPLSRESAGGQPEAMRETITNGTPRMPGFKYQFTAAQIAAIADYLKTLPPPVASTGGGNKGDVD